MASNVLAITVIGARGIPKLQDSNDFTDKFIKVIVGNQESRTVTKTSGNTVNFGETLTYDLSDVSDDDEIITTLFVKWTLSNGFVGEVRIPIQQVRNVSRKWAKEHWYPFGHGKAKVVDHPYQKGTFVGEIGLICGMHDPSSGDPNLKKELRGLDDPYYKDKSPDEIYMEANEVAKENEEALKRTLQVARETRDVGAKTLETIGAQSRQIQNAENDVEIIHTQITIGERKLRSMESCFCCCCACCGDDTQMQHKLKRQAARDAARQKAKEEVQRERVEMDRAKKKNELAQAQAANPNYKSAVLSQEDEFDTRVQNIDTQLDEVAEVVADLKEMAITMNEELDAQNQKLDKLNYTTESEMSRMGKVTERTKRLI